jgi:S-DNA-T family DNA segregation ATPase FtsK/SpoIIIE
MRLRLTGSQTSRDVAVTLPDGTVPLAEILRAAGASGFGEKVALDGRLVHVREPVGALPLYDGSAIDVHPSTHSLGVNAVDLVEVAGGTSGRIIPLPIGVHDIGRPSASGGVGTPVARIGVEPGGAVTLRSVGPREVRLDGAEVTGPVLEPLRHGMHLALGDTLVRIAPDPAGPGGLATAGSPRTFVTTHGTSGRVRYQRGPSATPGAAPPPPAPPERPQPVRPAPPLSWAMVIAPIPLAVVFALVLNPHFLIFAAFSPVLAFARWQEGKWRERGERRRATAARTRDLEGYAVALQAHAAHASARLRARTPDLAALRRAAEQGGRGLWSRRPGSPRFLTMAVGYGDLPADWELPKPGEPDVDRIAARHRVVPDVPLILDLDRHQGAGFVSSDDPAGIAASAVVQLAATHGPADVRLALVCDPARLAHWDWLKWLPHVQDAGGSPRVATTPDAIGGIFESVSPSASASAGRPGTTTRPAVSGRTLVVVVDSTALLDTVLARLAACPERALVRLVVLGASPVHLPAVCTAVVSVSGGRLTLTDLTVPAQVRGALPVTAAPPTVEHLARALARYVDPETDIDGGALPVRVDLGFLLGGVLDRAHLARWWRDHPGANLYATLGATDEGPLVVDLLADGPHMLVAGTTGAGKSELLRTLVASLACRYGPDRVNFVLLDFKGGGAFDACADLPHTVGVVTDLDDRLAVRALRCLRAELRHREQVLRAAGVGDLAQLTASDAPARLVLVIDEFATLAAELPDFMGSLVDIAQRGRSLGIHLVLATQRPAGVVDAKIRANTNLRLSLRVQSEADSLDVIATTAAAGISRRTPGRGFARLGAGELRGFQTALVSTATPVHAVTTVRVDPFGLAPDAVNTPVVRGAPTGSASTGRDEPTDLRRIVAATAELAAPMPPARVPWPDPLPELTGADQLWDGERNPRDDGVLLGLTDRPDQQRVDPFYWIHRDSSLIGYGADTATTTGVIVTACAGLARRYPADALHVYLLDFVPGNGIERIAHLPHVAARVSPADHERLQRVVDLIDTELDRRREAVRRNSVVEGLTGAGNSGGADGRESGSRQPLIMLGIAGYHILTGLAEEIGRLDLITRIERIATEGPELGIVAVLTTPHERGIPSRLAGQIRARLVFELADPNAYTSFGLRPRDVPNLRGSQAVDVATGEQIVVATPAVVVSAGEGSGGPPLVRTLPERIPLGELDRPSRIAGTGWHLVIGVRHRDLTATGVDLPGGTHLVVSGPPASGRTTALRTLAESAVSAAASVRVLSPRLEEWDDVPTLALEDPIVGPTLVVVDGLEAAAGHDKVLDGMVGDPRVRVIVADRQDAFRLPPMWLRTVLGARTGLLLQPQPDHGDLLRARLPMRTAVPYPAGRGYLVRSGLVDLIQVAETRPQPAPAQC